MKKGIPLLAFALMLLAAIGLQQRAVHRLRAEQTDLIAARNGADRLQSNPNPGGETNGADEIAQLKEEKQELLKLRNEIRQLRDRQIEFAAVRAENERLRATAGSRPELIQRETFINAGFASPTATLQTALWAFQSTNIPAYQQCFALERTFRTQSFARRSAYFAITGFKIEDSQMIAPDEIGLAVRVFESQEGAVNKTEREGPVIMKKVGNDWKIETANISIP